MEARAARFDEEDELKKLRTQVRIDREDLESFNLNIESSRKKFQTECFKCHKQFC